jgi:hypothetical protein
MVGAALRVADDDGRAARVMQHFRRNVARMGALGSLWQSWPPSLMLLEAIARAIGAIRVAGGQIMTSQAASAPASMSTSRSTSPSEAVVPFIFQFPATSGLRSRLAMRVLLASRRATARSCGRTAAPL